MPSWMMWPLQSVWRKPQEKSCTGIYPGIISFLKWLINLLTDCSVLKLYRQYFSYIRMEKPIESKLFLIKIKGKKLYLSFWKIVNFLVLVKDKKGSTMNHQICVHRRRKICCKPWFGVHIQQLLSCFSEIVAEYLV